MVAMTGGQDSIPPAVARHHKQFSELLTCAHCRRILMEPCAGNP